MSETTLNKHGVNERQRKFAEFYAENPNATEAAKLAGYSEKTARSQGQRLLTNVDIQKRIRELQEETARERIASMIQTKVFWSEIMSDTTQKTSDRLKASELLARSAGAFLTVKTFDESDNIADGDYTESDVIIYLPKIVSENERQLQSESEQKKEIRTGDKEST